MRLDKFLSDSGLFTRNDAKKFIKNKKISVDGIFITDPSFQISENSCVYFEGRKIEPYHNIYIMINKPSGYVSANSDSRYPCITQLIDHPYKNDLAVAGRLDIDVTGLVLLSNDGNFVHNVISPKKNIMKKYKILHDGILNEEKKLILTSGIDFKEYRSSEAIVEIINDKEFFLSIHEGKYHQVKRMVKYIGLNLIKLERTAVGGLNLDINIGDYRLLNEDDIKLIFGY